MGGQEPNRTATLSIAPSVAELQRENVVLELECIDRIYLNAFVPNLTSEKGIAATFANLGAIALRRQNRRARAKLRGKPPDHLNTEDVKGFLTDLAVRQNVAGATHNQAFNALLFFYRHVLRREFGQGGPSGPSRSHAQS